VPLCECLLQMREHRRPLLPPNCNLYRAQSPFISLPQGRGGENSEALARWHGAGGVMVGASLNELFKVCLPP
jgi:hypothetical protein